MTQHRVITTDGQRADEMSVLRRMQRRIVQPGTQFVRAYANFPLCCPARATFQTGQYAHNHGVNGNLSPRSPVGGFPALDTSNTVATWLDGAGYRTAYVGKYLNGYGDPNRCARRAGTTSTPSPEAVTTTGPGRGTTG